LAANAAPIIAARCFRSFADAPVDFGRLLADGQPILGNSKTWRGLFSAMATTCLLAPPLGFTYVFGLVFGALVMVGDLFSSFVKRRRGLAPSDQSLGLDQLPESLLPAIYAAMMTDMAWWWVLVLPLMFMAIQLLVSWPLYQLGIRKRPY
jgi:CDP-2,3-bis-(O-geranylgeranyl)-sn-glycerol synthase